MPIVRSVLDIIKIKKIRLHLSISMLFMILILPVLALIMVYSYYENSRSLISLANVQIERAKDDSIDVATNLLEPVAGTLRIIAQAAASNPAYFRTEQSRDLLYQALTSADQIDALYTSFEDGYHRVVTRMDADRRRSDRRIPDAVNWHSSYIDAFSGAAVRVRHRTFFDVWPNPILQYDDPSNVDVRVSPQYVAAKETRTFSIADPSVNLDTRSPVIFVGYPIIVDNEVIGVVSANITFNILARYLNTHKTSANSTTFIMNHSGQIIAHPDPASGIRTVEGKLLLATVTDLADHATELAGQMRLAAGADRLTFTDPATGLDYIAVFSRFPPSFQKAWEVAIVLPVDDFVGGLKQTNRNVAIFIIVSIAIEVLLIAIVAKRLAQPIERVSQEMQEFQSLQFPLALGASGNLMVGCANSNTQTVVLNPTANGGKGAIVTTIALVSGSDELAFDPTLNDFFVTGVDAGLNRIFAVISDANYALLDSVSLPDVNAHSIAVDPLTNDVFIPLEGTTTAAADSLCPNGCIAVFAQSPAPVPEPSSLPILGASLFSLAGLFAWFRRRRS